MKKFSQKGKLIYYKAETGEIVEIIPMREFYELDIKNKQYVKVREYALYMELLVNPLKKDVTD